MSENDFIVSCRKLEVSVLEQSKCLNSASLLNLGFLYVKPKGISNIVSSMNYAGIKEFLLKVEVSPFKSNFGRFLN